MQLNKPIARGTTRGTLRIATRESPLALWQADYIKNRLLNSHPALKVEIIGMTTRGDQILDRSLSKVGGKGLFLKELEEALLVQTADIAVHSMKDVTVGLPEGLEIPVVCERENPHDAFVSNQYESIDKLPGGAIVGTSSLRRKTQLMYRFPKLQFRDLRGNVNTRLRKLDDGEYDSIILAAAGLIRLKLEERITEILPTSLCLPAIGQGIIGVECREDDEKSKNLLSVLNNEQAQQCLQAERALNRELAGSCQAPIAGYAKLQGSMIKLHGSVGDVDNKKLLFASGEAKIGRAEDLGKQIAKELIAQGAKELIAKSQQIS